MVVSTELIFHNFYVGRVQWCWKNWFFTVSTLGGCGCFDRLEFFALYALRGCGGLDRTDLKQFPLWEGAVVLKDLIFSQFLHWKNWFLTVCISGGCSGVERTDFWQFLHRDNFFWDWFLTVIISGGCSGVERTDFWQFPHWDNVMVLK